MLLNHMCVNATPPKVMCMYTDALEVAIDCRRTNLT